MKKKPRVPPSSRSDIHTASTFGERAADAVAAVIGSWRFVIIQNAFVLAWILFNLVAIALRWDAYPFILLNLLFSWQASNTGPILQLSGNRQSQKDRARDDLEAEEVREILEMNREILKLLKERMGHE